MAAAQGYSWAAAHIIPICCSRGESRRSNSPRAHPTSKYYTRIASIAYPYLCLNRCLRLAELHLLHISTASSNLFKPGSVRCKLSPLHAWGTDAPHLCERPNPKLCIGARQKKEPLATEDRSCQATKAGTPRRVAPPGATGRHHTKLLQKTIAQKSNSLNVFPLVKNVF